MFRNYHSISRFFVWVFQVPLGSQLFHVWVLKVPIELLGCRNDSSFSFVILSNSSGLKTIQLHFLSHLHVTFERTSHPYSACSSFSIALYLLCHYSRSPPQGFLRSPGQSFFNRSPELFRFFY